MTSEDWREILEHTRMRVRQAGLSDVDEVVTLDLLSTTIPRDDFLQYLTRLIGAVSERSYSGYIRALQKIRESVTTEGGGSIEGIEIRVTESDFNLYRTERIDLSELNDFSPLIDQLKRLRMEIENSGTLNEQADS
jgi:hypothetical protein